MPVKAIPRLVHILWTIEAISIVHARLHSYNIHMPEMEGPVYHRVQWNSLHGLRIVMLSEQEEFNRGRMLRKERKIYPLFVGHRTQRMHSSCFYLVYLLCPWRYHLYSTPFSSIAQKSAAFSLKRTNRTIRLPT